MTQRCFLVLLSCLAGVICSAAEAPKLLPTGSLAREIVTFPDAMLTRNSSGRKTAATQLEAKISDFVVRQLDVFPSITQCQLEVQLRKLFGREDPVECQACGAEAENVPHAFTTPWGPKLTRRQVVVAYTLWFGSHGPGGATTVFENYLWENGRSRLTIRSADNLSGFWPSTELLAWYPKEEQYWILAWGVMSGSSGRTILGRATIFRVGVDSVQTVWDTPALGNLSAAAHHLEWEVRYVDRDRFYGQLPKPNVLDVYLIDYTPQTFRRIAHVEY